MDETRSSRAQWGSKFGFLMAAIGSAVGLGNIWGFPFKMGQNGGFAFLLVYVVLAVFVGYIIMNSELALGRRTGKGIIGASTPPAAASGGSACWGLFLPS